MSWVCTPYGLKKLFPQLIWEMPDIEKTVYLTFDDGPTPGVTPRVLDFLLQYQVQATFFCLGSRAEQCPSLPELIRAGGHTVGNHGYLHLSGFTTASETYYENARRGAIITNSNLFRPPYGRIAPWQISALKKYYRIVMWTIMSMDFSYKTTVFQCLKNVKENIHPGAIIVFHDSVQAGENLLQVLPDLLNWLKDNGYQAKAIPNGTT
jgi:peptidoglycan-N-acetylglucosamine deacetylase